MGGIVLVHGAWHTGWCWHKVAAGLSAEGIDVRVTELHRGSLADDTVAVQSDVDALRQSTGGPVVVCGHSYGGVPTSNLRPEGVAHLVFLAAFMLDAEETALGMFGGAGPTLLFEAMQQLDDGSTIIDPTRAAEVFYGDCSPRDQEEAIANLRPQSMTAGLDVLSRVCWREVASTYVVCSDDQVARPDLQRQFAARASEQLEWASSHSPFLSHPELVVDLLIRLAAAVPGE